MYVFVWARLSMPDQLLRNNLRLARSRWHQLLGRSGRHLLKLLTNEHQFSIANGDLIWLERGWYVTHTLAHEVCLR
jgi:hypothetical protein